MLILCFLGITLSTHAQTRFGVKVGLNIANQKAKSDPTLYVQSDFKPVLGFQLGGIIERELSKNFFLQSGLQLSSKGFSEKSSFITQSANPIYLELPILVGYGIALGKAQLNLLLGGYAGYGIAGKAKFSGGTISNAGKIYWTNERNKGGMRPLDFGLCVGTSLEFENTVLGLQYGLGLANISTSDIGTLKNRALSISVAYMFGKKSK